MKNKNAFEIVSGSVREQKFLLEEVFEAWAEGLITKEDYFTECLGIVSKNVEVLEKR